MNNKTNLKKINKILSSSLASSLALGMITPAVSASEIETSSEYNASIEEASTLQEISEEIGTDLTDKKEDSSDTPDSSPNLEGNLSTHESSNSLSINETPVLPEVPLKEYTLNKAEINSDASNTELSQIDKEINKVEETSEELCEDDIDTLSQTDFSIDTIGNPAESDNNILDTSADQITLNGTGSNLGNKLSSDNCHFVNFAAKGDATITARIKSFDMSQATKGQVGIFFVNDISSAESDYFGVYINDKKYKYGYRDSEKNSNKVTNLGLSTSSASNDSEDKYVKIIKQTVDKGKKGKVTNFTYYISDNKDFEGDNTLSKTITIYNDSDTWYTGFAVTNGTSKSPATATFTDISIEDENGFEYKLDSSNTEDDEDTNAPTLPEIPGVDSGNETNPEKPVDEETPVIPEVPQEPEDKDDSLPKKFNKNSIGNNEDLTASFTEEKEFIVNGTGTYIGKDANSTDNYSFVNYEMTGNCTIIARLKDFNMDSAYYGQAGVFIRSDNSSDNAHYFGVYVEPSKDEYRYAFRDSSRCGAATIGKISSLGKDKYIKIVKDGNTFRYFISDDASFTGDNVITNSQSVNTSENKWYVGFVVSNGGQASAPASTTFDNVIISKNNKEYYNSESTTQTPVQAVENLKSEVKDNIVNLSWDHSEDATEYIVKRSSQAEAVFEEIHSIKASDFGLDTASFADEINNDNFVYYYKVTAKNEYGESDSEIVRAVSFKSELSNHLYGADAAVFKITEEPNATVFDSSISLKGSVNEAGTIAIEHNGKIEILTKNENGEFSCDVKLYPGRNAIKLIHTSDDGKISTKNYNILYVSEKSYDMIVDCNYNGIPGEKVDGIQMFNNLQDAVNSVSDKNTERKIIYVKNGTYKKKITIKKPNISIIGENSSKTIITNNFNNGRLKSDGTTYGTSGSASVTITEKAVGFTAENITFENAFEEKGKENEQAVAVNNQADQSMFINCRFLGNQDTLLANAASSSPARQYYSKCYIEGDVDFIFGRAQAVFDDCDIASFNRGSDRNNGYVTAANTWDKDAFGYLFINSRLIGLKDTNGDLIEDKTVSLGRPWRPSSAAEKVTPSVAYIDCYMGSHIKHVGWEDMGYDSKASDSRFFEYGSYGPGAVFTETRNVLSDKNKYTIENVFAKDSASDSSKNPYKYDWNPNSDTDDINILNIYAVLPEKNDGAGEITDNFTSDDNMQNPGEPLPTPPVVEDPSEDSNGNGSGSSDNDNNGSNNGVVDKPIEIPDDNISNDAVQNPEDEDTKDEDNSDNDKSETEDKKQDEDSSSSSSSHHNKPKPSVTTENTSQEQSASNTNSDSAANISNSPIGNQPPVILGTDSIKTDETGLMKIQVDGEPVSGWCLVDNQWYYTDSQGTVETGWVQTNDTWYYMGEDGTMDTGWVNDGQNWYYLSDNGSMETGWIKTNDSWYYLNDNGSMKTGWIRDNNSWYYLNDNGSMKTGWIKDNNNWYYLNNNGSMKTGWVKDNNDWYYLNSDGSMAKNTTIDGYAIDSNGAWIK